MKWTIEDIRSRFDWSNTRADMVDRVTRAIESQQETIAACTGSLDLAKQITWVANDFDHVLSANNFRFDAGGWAGSDESVLATRIN